MDYQSDIRGNWTESLYIDDQLLWHIDDHKGYKLRPYNKPLSSDCRFREDLKELKKGDEANGQVSFK